MSEHEGSGYPVTTGEAILALRKFAKGATDYEKLILNWTADHLEQEKQDGDLISRSALYSKICALPSNIGLYDADEVERLLKEANAVEAEPVVHCGECIYRNTVSCVLDGLHFGTTEDNDFCSRGKRRTEHGN